jgi:hypothetical protein
LKINDISRVALIREQGVGGSNPLAPTILVISELRSVMSPDNASRQTSVPSDAPPTRAIVSPNGPNKVPAAMTSQ